MSILVDRNTRVVVQGITGKEGAFHAARCKEYGTTVVGGVTPGKGGTTHEGFAVWNTVEESVRAEGVIAAVKKLGLKLPVVLRAEGTNVELGKQMLAQSGLALTMADDMADGAKKAVAFARTGK